MGTKTISKWSEFGDALEEIRQEHGLLRFNDEVIKENTVLYRGQNDSEHTLLTTLERFSQKKYDVEQYCHISGACAPQIESLTGANWNLPDFSEILEELKEKADSCRVHVPRPAYGYWVYLRHHGFPSPLLDWTKSPYVAAFFAFCEKTNPAPEYVSIFVYIERPKGIKGGSGGSPTINAYGPYVRTHKRHFLQKAMYTICTQYDYSSEGHYFVPHEKVFAADDKEQDVLIKINIPSSERMTALKDLDKYNINYFSLFQSEDALVKSLAFSELELKDR